MGLRLQQRQRAQVLLLSQLRQASVVSFFVCSFLLRNVFQSWEALPHSSLHLVEYRSMVSRLNSSKFCRQDADCCSELLLTQKSEKSKSIQIISMHLLETRTSLYIIFRYYMILYNDWFIDVIILSLSFALWISPPRSCWQEGGGPAALGLRPMQQPSLRQTQAVLLLGWKGLIAHITSIWSPWITNLHIMFDHVWYFVDLSCTSVYRGVAKMELCDGVCCFSTSPHIWNCMKLPFLGWL